MKRGDGSLAVTHSCTILLLISLMLHTLATDQLAYNAGRCAAHKWNNCFEARLLSAYRFEFRIHLGCLPLTATDRLFVCVGGSMCVFSACVHVETEPVCSLWSIVPLYTAAQHRQIITPEGLFVPL